jgi:flagellar protein FliL
MSKKEDAPAGDAAPKKGKKKLIMMVLAALFLLGGGAGGYLMLTGGGADEPPPPPEPGIVVALDAVTINLAEGHYLKIKLALQASAEAGEEVDGSKALDVTITKFSDMKIGELSSPAGRAKAKAELLEKIREAYEEKVIDIYFTEFVMQ